MDMQIPQKLSARAVIELREIYAEEFDETLTEGEAQEMGSRLLRFFDILLKESVSTRIDLNEREKRAADYIAVENMAGRFPTVRGIARAAGFKSSRSGKKLQDSLVAKGWLGRSLS
jgi:hypothetical protein